MIFVTVGTHEQPFDRLLREIDCLKEGGKIQEEVVMQIGYSSYEPRACQWERFYPYTEMSQKIKNASAIITHGAPASFILPIQYGKVPIVVPRFKEYNEHVNNHQVEFCDKYSNAFPNKIIVLKDVKEILDKIDFVRSEKEVINTSSISNNKIFCQRLENIVERL